MTGGSICNSCNVLNLFWFNLCFKKPSLSANMVERLGCQTSQSVWGPGRRPGQTPQEWLALSLCHKLSSEPENHYSVSSTHWPLLTTQSCSSGHLKGCLSCSYHFLAAEILSFKWEDNFMRVQRSLGSSSWRPWATIQLREKWERRPNLGPTCTWDQQIPSTNKQMWYEI